MNREKIIEKATQLIIEKGDLGWSYSDIAEYVNIKKASVHYYFPKKENLIEAVTEQYIENVISLFQEKISSRENPIEKLKGIFEVYRSVFCNPGKICLCLSLSQDTQRMSPLVTKKIKGFFDFLHQLILSIIVQGKNQKNFKMEIDPDDTAFFIECSLQGLIIMSQYDYPTEKFDNSLQQIIELIKI